MHQKLHGDHLNSRANTRPIQEFRPNFGSEKLYSSRIVNEAQISTDTILNIIHLHRDIIMLKLIPCLYSIE